MEEIQELREGRPRGNSNFALSVGLYNHDSSITVANFFTINLRTGCTKDMRA